MCCISDPTCLMKIQQSGAKWIWASKCIRPGGRPLTGNQRYRYKPGWNYAESSPGHRWTGDYDIDKPRGCHGFWSYRKTRRMANFNGEKPLWVKILVKDIVRANTYELVCRKLFISKANWKKAGLR